MIKIRNKRIAMLLVLTMLATMFVGVGAASAAGNITALTTPTISDSDNQTLGKIKVIVPAGVIATGDAIVVNLPDDYEFSSAVAIGAVGNDDTGTVNEVYVPDYISTSDLNSLTAAGLTVAGGKAGSDSFTITATGNQDSMNDGVFYIALDDIDASSASSGEAVVTFDGSTNTGFPRGTVIVGTLASDGEVTLSAKSTQTRNDDFTFTLRIRESLAGSFVDKSKSIKLKLPNGYEWDTNNTTLTPDTVWGDNTVDIDVAINNAGDTITLTPTPAESTEASCWEIPLKFYVDDEDDVVAGAIEATISGSSSLSPSKLKVGTYGDYDATVKAGETVPTLLAGFEEQEIADIIVKESMKESLQANRTITLTLPAGARWQEAILGNSPETFDSDSGLSLDNVGFTGTDDRTAKYTVKGQSSSAAELSLENAEIAIEPGFSGDLVVTVAGNAGVKGEIIVAKVVTPVTVAVSAKTDVEIGQAGQAVGDITITEAEAGAIKDGKLTLRLPEGFKWTNRGTVSVEAGNVKIDSTTTKGDNDRNLVIDVTSDSTTASEIKLTGATITVNRTVAEGEFKVFVLGSAVLDPLKDAKGDAIWPNSTTAANAVLGTIITAAGGNIANTGIFTIGSTTYTINGVEKTMDVAPYISDSRTYMPIRYVAYAMGIDDNNILWDGDQRTVTLIKGDKVVQMAIGSKTLLINGAAVTMDVAPVITSDRTMLPIAFVAQAFGSVATWDATTQTVTIK